MRNKTMIKMAVPVAIGAMMLTACGGDSGDGDGNFKIAFQGPLSGDNVALGENMQNGVKLAIKQANESGDLDFELSYMAADDQGLPDKATAAAQTAIDDGAIAVVGPAFSGPTNSASPLYAEAGLVTVSPSATNPNLTDAENNFTSFLRGVPNDNQQGAAMASYYAKKLQAKKVYLIDDKTDYGVGLSKVAEKDLKAAGVTVLKKSVPQKTPDYSATAKDVVNSKADALIYAGYYQDLAPLAKKLKEAGYKGAGISGDGSNDAKFVELAGDASEGWYLTCPCTDATVEAGTKKFAEDYQKEFDRAPGTYSAEAYDITNMIIQEIKKLGKDNVERENLREALAKASYKGLTKTFSFGENGEFNGEDVFLYQVNSGKIEYQGNVAELVG